MSRRDLLIIEPFLSHCLSQSIQRYFHRDTSEDLHLEKFLFIFLQCFNFLLRKRNYWLELRVMVGFICILCGGIMVLMTVLCREGSRGNVAGW